MVSSAFVLFCFYIEAFCNFIKGGWSFSASQAWMPNTNGAWETETVFFLSDLGM